MKKNFIARAIAYIVYDIACAIIICDGAEKIREIRENSEKSKKEKAKDLAFYGTGFAGALIGLVAGYDRIDKALKG